VGAENLVRGLSLELSVLFGMAVGAAKQAILSARLLIWFHARAREYQITVDFGKAYAQRCKRRALNSL
jgi:hypothetical protein